MKTSEFQKIVLDFYKKEGRHTLPWRQTTNPYHTLVSELMLQQTQVDRVIPKYNAFIKRWPTTKALSRASLAEVLTMWQGLGYNRRAKFLHQTAKEVVSRYKGTFPKSESELLSLPGVGPYTAKAILAFSYNEPVVLIETNVRQVFIHHYFHAQKNVADKDILSKVAETLPKKKAREWYSALMDYGSLLKKENGNNTKKSSQYRKQSAFKGSNREVRGSILKLLTVGPCTIMTLKKQLNFSAEKILEQLEALEREGLVTKKNRVVQLAT